MGEYGRRIVVDIPFERAVAETSAAIRAEGFDLVSTIDLRDYLAKHAHHDCRRYLLLGALLPQLALDALREDRSSARCSRPRSQSTSFLTARPRWRRARRLARSRSSSAGARGGRRSPRWRTV